MIVNEVCELNLPGSTIRRRQWHPTLILLPGKIHWRRSLEGCSPWGRTESDTTERLHFHALEKEMVTHSSVLAWRIPGAGEPGGLPSMGSHRVRHDWSDLAAAAAAVTRDRKLSYLCGTTKDVTLGFWRTWGESVGNKLWCLWGPVWLSLSNYMILTWDPKSG